MKVAELGGLVAAVTLDDDPARRAKVRLDLGSREFTFHVSQAIGEELAVRAAKRGRLGVRVSIEAEDEEGGADR